MERLGLSRTALTRVLAGMFLDGLLEEVRAVPSSSHRGRPAHLLRLRVPPCRTLAVWVRNRHTDIAVVDETGALLDHVAAPIALADGLPAVVEAVRAAVPALRTLGGRVADRCVVVVPTAVRADGEVDAGGAQDLMPTWIGPRARRSIGHAAGIPTHLRNDGQVGALAESRLGAGIGAGTMLFVEPTADGIAGGLLLDGVLHLGGGTAGEISHVNVRSDGVTCPCGQRGCVAAEVRAVVRDFERAFGAGSDPEAVAVDGAAGPHVLRRLVEDVAELVGRAVAGIVNVVHPDVVVVRDSVTAWTGLDLVAAIRRTVRASVHPALVGGVRVVPSELDALRSIAGVGFVPDARNQIRR